LPRLLKEGRLMRSRFAWVLGCSLVTAACSADKDPGTFFGPSGTERNGRLLGTLVEYGTGVPIANATLLLAGTAAVSDRAGVFEFKNVPATGTAVISVEPMGYLRRSFSVNLEPLRTGVVVDAIRDVAPFSLLFYREWARNGLEGFQFEATRRWTVAPSFYFNLITVGSGLRVTDETIAKISDIFRRSVRELSHGKFEVAAIETGVTPRDAQEGWVNVTFYAQMAGFGSASVGGNTGVMSLRYDPNTVSTPFTNPYNCVSSVVAVADHEITHTMGFWHTTNVMVDSFSGEGCPGDGRPPQAVYHAGIVYDRPGGNRDLDNDPETIHRALAPERGRPMPGPVVACFR
jgi:hypothetical protein